MSRCFGLETIFLKRIYGIAQCLIMSSLSHPFCDIRFESFLLNTTLLSYLNVAPTCSITFLPEHTIAHSFLMLEDN